MIWKKFFILVSILLLIACATEPQKQAPVASKSATVEPQPTPPEETAQQESTPPAQSEAPVFTGNHPPVLKSAKIVATETGGLKIDVETFDEDGDEVNLSYAWLINGVLVSSSNSVPSVKKGDMVAVTVTPNDGSTDGRADTITTIIKNSPPIFETNENLQISPEGRLTYQLKAKDADGDLLKYSLVQGPAGMKIDPNTGLITWDTASVPDGPYSATAEVTDGASSARYTFQVNLSKQPG